VHVPSNKHQRTRCGPTMREPPHTPRRPPAAAPSPPGRA
jgi:hypothetical protein